MAIVLLAFSRFEPGSSIVSGDSADEEVSGGESVGYPSHFRPVLVHLLQKGFSSPHFFRRILNTKSVNCYCRGLKEGWVQCVILASQTSASDLVMRFASPLGFLLGSNVLDHDRRGHCR